MKVLVTGGAGFIGSHLTDLLVKEGHRVTVFDNLDPQVHPGGKIPRHLNPEAEFIEGDVRDREAFSAAIKNAEAVFHKAGAVGVGQSQYKINYYAETNVMGTANLLDILVNEKTRVGRVVVAASMSSYGEGLYNCTECGKVRPGLRPMEQMEKGEWELKCPGCGREISPIPTTEDSKQNCNSIYSITKMNQEQMVLNIGKTYDIPSIALRYFNVYGPRQSLSNPYTGVAAIFMSRIKNGKPPVIYEDGLQTRDFISVFDVARANLLALTAEKGHYHSFNIGSGTPLTISSIAETLAKLYGREDIRPDIRYKFRKGDVRHCYADTGKAEKLLEFKTAITFEEGMDSLIKWAETAEADDRLDGALAELKERGLA